MTIGAFLSVPNLGESSYHLSLSVSEYETRLRGLVETPSNFETKHCTFLFKPKLRANLDKKKSSPHTRKEKKARNSAIAASFENSTSHNPGTRHALDRYDYRREFLGKVNCNAFESQVRHPLFSVIVVLNPRRLLLLDIRVMRAA